MDELFVYETLTFELTTYEETYKKVSEKVQELANDWNLQARWNYKGQLQGYYVNMNTGGMILMSKYSIVNTTKEEREKFVANAEAINSLGAEPLTKENRALLKMYVDGDIELDDLRKKIIDKYKKN
ncbi:antitoxin VbhA family protein [Massilibacterium senegalense]|uniref:antitoxin VbhA family protein n=1 Tax=Massilibacterium senegalense TaxID=1632858 RepID=UPI00078629CB|nr:antitoxin VbhA family protein [Massilibacterium senegalense]